MDLYIADGFTTQRFSGNPAGVALLARQGVEAPTAAQALARLEGGEVLSLPLLAGDRPALIDWEEWRPADGL